MVSDFSDLSHRLRVTSRKRTVQQVNLCLRLGIWAGVLVSVAIIVVCAAAYLANSALFSVRHITIKGAFHVKADEALGLMDIGEGDNILTWNMHEARRMLEAHPWIEKVRISRSFLPASLEVEITERRPEATLILEDKPYLVTGDGVPFLASPEVFYGLVIHADGFTKDDMGSGLSDAMKHALAWARLAGSRGLDVLDVAIEPGFLMNMRLKNSLVFTVFGAPNPVTLDRALKVIKAIKPVEGTIMDLRCQDKIVLRTRGAHGGEG